ncbi:MAG: hypothetical protein KAJ86_00805 [Alphaproteobacteria bacterium]|nr:hypothetical protein [Alphaproteobacteria bacterium]
MITYCPITGINLPRFLITTVAAFVFIFSYEFVVHAILLAEQYEATKEIWRSPEEMQPLMHWATLTQALYAMLVSMLYAIFVNSADIKKNIKFGLIFGLITGIGMFGMYPYSPIPMSLALSWLVSGIGEGIGLGLICGLTYKNTANKNA